MYASQIWSTPFIQRGKEMDNPVQKWLLIVLERILGVRDTTPSMCVMRECGLEHLQFNWFCATMRLHNSLTQCNSTTAKHILHADMRLSSRSADCWSSHIVSAMTGLVQEYMLKNSCGTVNPLTSIALFWTSEGDTRLFGHPTLIAAQKSTTAKF